MKDRLKHMIVWFLCLSWIKRLLKEMEGAVQRAFPGFYRRFFQKLKMRIKEMRRYVMRQKMGKIKALDRTVYWSGEKMHAFGKLPLVSVIVPNYNHAQYLRGRLESIYHQTYTNYEVILLDDASTDDSRNLLEEYARRYPDKTRLDFNEKNSGSVFSQWKKGLESARGSLIWIAESDDWCEADFLEKLVVLFEYESVMLAFARSVFMQEDQQIWTLEEYLADLPELDFDNPFFLSAHMAVKKGFAVKNIIPNVSSAVFRNLGNIPEEVLSAWGKVKLCGDWIFYLYLIRGGTIGYTNETCNYYRIHADSTSTKIQRSDDYYREQELVSCYVASHYRVELSLFSRVRQILEEHCRVTRSTEDVTPVHRLYSLDTIAKAAKKRKPNVLMCSYSMQIGGGETYPILLANEMKRQGVCVTFLNFDMESYSKEVRQRLAPSVPLVNLFGENKIGEVLYQTGAEVVHSHHASVDYMISVWLEFMEKTECRQIVTFHGMYEALEPENSRSLLLQLEKTCNHIIYLADKNCQCLEQFGLKDRFSMTKLDNGMPFLKPHAIDRLEYGIGEKDFVFCLAGRAIKEKGWLEAAEAVIEANKRSRRRIHLILLGEGEMREKVLTLESEYLHAIGQKSNVSDYFASSDMGLLPSYFKGESYPLVIMECMMAGKPVIATDVGEVSYQMEDEKGDLAGILLPLNDWSLDIGELIRVMIRAANDQKFYETLCSRVSSATKKFDIEKIVKRHIEIYLAL